MTSPAIRRGRWLLWAAAAACFALLGVGPVSAEEGEGEDPPAPASDGVGMVDPTTGLWYLRDPATGETTSFYYGNPGDAPFVGDWDCDGIDTPGLYRQSDGYVYLRNSNAQGIADVAFFFGNPGDVPLAGDFDGDGCDTVAIYRPSEARVYVIDELGEGDEGLGTAAHDYVFGDGGETPFVGDFDADGIDEVGLHRPSSGRVYLSFEHRAGVADADFVYGDAGDRVVSGDWDGDGDDTVGLFRPQRGVFYLDDALDGGAADAVVGFGARRMIPVAGRFGNLPGGDVPPLGIVAEFTTFFPCCQARVTNIQIIADTVDGAVVAPGAAFSLNQHAGQRTADKGYVPAGAIIGGVLYCCDHPANIGGGVSQFATTLFNAVFFAGYEVVDHSPHSLYFTRYPMGREATIVYPDPDLVFTNDTATPLLIEARYTATSITVRLYGNNEGRVVSDSRIGSATPAEGGLVTVVRSIRHASGAVTSEAWTHRYRARLDQDPPEPAPPPPPPDPPPAPL